MELCKEQQPRYKIVSMRLRDDEWEALRSRCLQSKKTVSDFLRQLLYSEATVSLDTGHELD